MKTPQTDLDETMFQARYEHLHAEAQRVGMERLGEWKGFNATYWFQCPEGHRTKRHLKLFSERSSLRECQTCHGNARVQQLLAKAQQAGLSLLSKQWLGAAAAHQFRCPQGHTWEHTGRAASRMGQLYCLECRGGSRLGQYEQLADGLDRLREAARRRGGECLSPKYLGMRHKYEFRCAKGHVWQASAGSVLGRKGWCGRCQNNAPDPATWAADGLARLSDAAVRRGGECLAKEYLGARKYYRFRCAKGHEWETTAAHIRRGAWCKPCATALQRRSIEDAQGIAATRGGQCLSTEYVNNKQKLQWVCHRGHSWQAAFSNINAGQWCPACKFMNRLSDSRSKARRKYEAVDR